MSFAQITCWLSHKKEKSPLTHGLNYRSACDHYRPKLNSKFHTKAIEIHLGLHNLPTLYFFAVV